MGNARCEWGVARCESEARARIAGLDILAMLTAVVHPIVPILNQNGAHASSPVVDAQLTTETIANVETHIMSEMIAHTIPDRSCRSLPRI